MIQVGLKIKALREGQGKSVRGLALECGLSPGLISQIESGRTSPSLSTLVKISEKLQCSVGSFFEEAVDEEALVKKDTRRKLIFADREPTYELITPPFLDGKLRLLMISLKPQQYSSPQRISHRDQEVCFVQRGTITVEFEEQQFFLEEGDSLTFDSAKPHRFYNPGLTKAELLLAVYS